MEALSPAAQRELKPLKYHNDLAEYLKQEEPQVWDWATSANVRLQQSEEMRDAMLRQTYRLEAASHPAVFAACAKAMERLEIEAPATLYQAADGVMNASLYYIPGEVHLVFSGPTLERLSDDELLALLGHELAHYKLWSADDGAYYVASRVLDLALSFPDAKPSHRETARLLSLHTELYADRGAAPAVSMLVKVMTGLSSVDPAAYLRQAGELEASKTKSAGQSHPESFLRARSLELWWQGSETIEDWIAQRLHGPISIETLDLLRQRELTRTTRAFLGHFIALDCDLEDPVLTQVRRYFPEFTPSPDRFDFESIGPEKIDDPTRDYFIALMFDCAMADPEQTDELMVMVANSALSMGAEDQLKSALKRDLKWTKSRTDGLFKRAAKAA
jgi:Peptidase family M48